MPDLADLSLLELAEGSELPRLLREVPGIPVLRFRDGEYLIREGEEARDAFFIVKGAIAVEHASQGGPPTVLATILCDPESIGVVGEMAWFGAGRRSASVRSAGATWALQLGPELQDTILAGYPDLTRILCATLARRLKETNQLLMDLQRAFHLEALPRQAADGEVLFRGGEPATTLFQLAFGAIRLEDGRTTEIVHAEQLPSGFLGLEPYLRRSIHTCTATVEGLAFLAAVDEAHRPALVRSHPELVLSLLER